MRIPVIRKPVRFEPDFRRVIILYYDNGFERSVALINKIISMSEQEAKQANEATLREYARRHRNLTKQFMSNYEKASNIAERGDICLDELSMTKKLLIGSFFSKEYSIESTAFFNPSIVESPDQTGLEEGSKRVIMSFRAMGEGHLSSIAFRSGVIDKNGDLHFLIANRYIDEAEIIKRHEYTKTEFINKLTEMKVSKEYISLVMDRLNDRFIYGELLGAVSEILEKNNSFSSSKKRAINEIVWLADSHYEIVFSRDTDISERVIFPISFTERQGIEDARFVKFREEDGSTIYYATYTAYDGHTILPKLIETRDFYHFTIRPLHGSGAQNKNMAIFPRKIKGKYAMLSRIDGINSYIGFSDIINIWDDPIKIQSPKHYWEFIQLGNCGSPIETPEGWLIITHGVGPMRQYDLSASLLDLEDPTKEIGRLSEPLLISNENERDGLVPNVVYSCGSFVNGDTLVIPYGMSDTYSSLAFVDLKELLKRLK